MVFSHARRGRDRGGSGMNVGRLTLGWRVYGLGVMALGAVCLA